MEIEIRAYDDDEESIHSTHTEDSSAQMEHEDIPDGDDVALRFTQNEEYMEAEIEQWETRELKKTNSAGVPIKLVVKPQASKMSHRLLNPYIYRNIKDIDGLAGLATMLNTPPNWEEKYNQVKEKRTVIHSLTALRRLPIETRESDVQTQFGSLVSMIATHLDIGLQVKLETKIIVGGMFTKNEYDVRSRTDPHFLGENNRHLIASEAKRSATFGDRGVWYYRSRGIQTLSALYRYGCPTFLYTQNIFKVFVENAERNAIYTYPYNDDTSLSEHVRSTLVQPMGSNLIKAIVICLLSERNKPEKGIDDEVKIELKLETPIKGENIPKQLYLSTKKPPTNKSERSSIQNKKPRYVSGYVDGQPVYTEIRVYSGDEVEEVEAEIAEEEKRFKKENSEKTLIEK
ncbi:hypothetical protein HK103_000698 [Boothiomyces macroporosus]|uniref:Uncharacterized protein n=1 Tax=Boothiomyces macroporosus TaxID=261099 RepID=A0AAD5UEK1_9FUNG|nr:hypothetical protein HK103_000698 [Boothiomyces macroporosus]